MLLLPFRPACHTTNCTELSLTTSVVHLTKTVNLKERVIINRRRIKFSLILLYRDISDGRLDQMDVNPVNINENG